MGRACPVPVQRNLKDRACVENRVAALKEAGTAHWVSPNTGATNSSGFTGLPGGNRYIDGQFSNIGIYGYFWSSTFVSPTEGVDYYLGNNSTNFIGISHPGNNAFSVRLVKD